MDLIILALIAGFIIYRLYATLGEKTGYKGDENSSSNIVDFKAKKQKNSNLEPSVQAEDEEIDPKILPGIQKITKIDPEFSLKEFTEGATIAFEMVLEAYVSGDLKTLKKILSSTLYIAFKGAINDRNSKGHVLENTLVRVEDVIIEKVDLQEKKAKIHVRYVTEQVPVTKDKHGEIIEGNPNQIDQVIDTWTFERSLKSRDPNWCLISTES